MPRGPRARGQQRVRGGCTGLRSGRQKKARWLTIQHTRRLALPIDGLTDGQPLCIEVFARLTHNFSQKLFLGQVSSMQRAGGCPHRGMSLAARMCTLLLHVGMTDRSGPCAHLQVLMTLGKALEIAAQPGGRREQFWCPLSKARTSDVVRGELCCGFAVMAMDPQQHLAVSLLSVAR